MGADQDLDWAKAAASALDWWRDAGVDVLVEDAPFDWLAQPVPIAASAAAPEPITTAPLALPDTLEAFAVWRLGQDVPEARWGGAAIGAAGPATADVMILVDCPERGDRDALLEGEVGRLFDRMLAAIGLVRADIMLASVCTRRPTTGRVPYDVVERLGEIVRHHVALVQPKRLLVMGDAATRAVLRTNVSDGRGRLHAVNHQGVNHNGAASTQVVASDHPRFLLDRPAAKAEAWRDFVDADREPAVVTTKLLLAAALCATALATPAAAEPAPPAVAATAGIPPLLSAEQRTAYRTVFAALRESRWTDAQIALDLMAPGPLHAFARAELYTAKGSPRVDGDAVLKLLTEAPELPQGDALLRIAKARGLTDLPVLPLQQRLIWQDGAPVRARAKATKSDLIAADLALKMQPFVKADMAEEAQALLEATYGLTPEAQTEWQARIAWMYFLRGMDVPARSLATKAAAGTGDWTVQGHWTNALAAWRQRDCASMQPAFENVVARATDTDLRATALYWTARADMVCGQPDRVEARLKSAAQFKETFYGLLARQALGLDIERMRPQRVTSDWAALERRPNIRIAAALAEIGENEEADGVIRQQARIGDPIEFASLIRLTETLDLPATVVWLAHNMPQGVTATADTRYPMPNWTPDTGWRIDKALVYAHTLQESGFRARIKSPAGAYGLMQIMPAAATDYMRERGVAIDQAALTRPSTNIDIGQRHIEKLRDMGLTGGLLPKVIAAYNAGPRPVGEWNGLIRDGGDPLLYIESIPYWETRGYVVTVLRNYWMYEAQGGKPASPSRAALAQGMWPRFPGLPGATAVRMNAQAPVAAIAINAAVAMQAAVRAD